jgi:hypothetical protein
MRPQSAHAPRTAAHASLCLRTDGLHTHAPRRPPAQANLSGNDHENFRNFPISGVADADLSRISQLGSLVGVPNTGKPYSYVWWVVCFQLFCMNSARAALHAPPGRRVVGALALHTVLTVCTFLLTEEVLNAPFGVYMMSHNQSGTQASVVGTKGNRMKNGLFLLFAGLVVCSAANAGLLIALAQDDDEQQRPSGDDDVKAAATHAGDEDGRGTTTAAAPADAAAAAVAEV